MKIGFVLDDTLDSSDGVQQYVLIVGDWLAKNGHEVHYLVGETARTDVANIHSMSKNIKVKFNKNRMSIPFPANKKSIKQLLARLDLDVLHVQMPYSPQMAARVISNVSNKTSVIATFHILPFSRKERLATKVLAKSVKKSSERISQVISVSRPAAEFAKSSFGIESSVIPNPVVIPKAKHRKTADSMVRLVYLGRLVERKGIMELLKAFHLLTESNLLTPVKLEIAGTGHLGNKIDDYVNTNSLAEKVSRLGFIDENDKPKVLGGADIAVFPSLGGESFGIVLTEAMAYGAGVDLGGQNNIYKNILVSGDVLFDPDDTEALAKKLKNLIEDSALRTRLHKQQQELVKQYDIEVVGPKILGTYQRAIAKGSQ